MSLGALPLMLFLVAILLGLLVLYYVLLVRALLEMLRSNVNPILLTFGFLSLLILPPTLLLGIPVLITWHFHKRDLPSAG